MPPPPPPPPTTITTRPARDRAWRTTRDRRSPGTSSRLISSEAGVHGPSDKAGVRPAADLSLISLPVLTVHESVILIGVNSTSVKLSRFHGNVRLNSYQTLETLDTTVVRCRVSACCVSRHVLTRLNSFPRSLVTVVTTSR